ncbi:MAG: hypothetical protein KDA28_01485, partial [Phycisphaerales bacterium]|nr:hypothetical protein [Phycisphaerales bacterium]
MSTTTRQFTRDDIIQLGRSSSPWAFLPVVSQALRVAPEDPVLLFLAASHFERLGMTPVVFDLLGHLPPEVRSTADVSAFVESLNPTNDSRIPHDERRAILERNLDALDP